jgi:cyclopropane fatty-acyl-phospholipid synthase-like methyltransferase
MVSNSEDDMGLTVRTGNRRGWISTSLFYLSRRFVEHCADHRQGPVLDMGCGLGLAAVSAARKGVYVVAVDLSLAHLIKIREEDCAPGRVIPIQSRFPDNSAFRASAFQTIHCANMLNFLTGEEIVTGARLMYEWLRPGGQLFLQISTPFNAIIASFVPVYEQRKAAGVRWPGIIEDVSKFTAPEIAANLPPMIHPLEIDIVRPVYADAGFEIEESLEYRPSEQPSFFYYDGRETGFLSAHKPA